MSEQTAHVDVLTAEVKTLMIGNRQVTLSVYGQLDRVRPDAIEPFGRVQTKEKWIEQEQWGIRDEVPHISVVGRVRDGFVGAGSLVRARVRTDRQYWSPPRYMSDREREQAQAEHEARELIREEWSALPLIVLAGLR